MPSLPQGGRLRKTQAPLCPERNEIRREIPEAFRKWEQKRELQRKSGSGKEVSSCILPVKANGTEVISAWRSGSLRSTVGTYQQKASWGLFAGKSGQVGSMWLGSGAVGLWWGVGPLHGMYGSMAAEFEVQRTIKKAEMTAFLCLLKRVIGPTRAHVDNKGIVDGLRRGERECIKPRAGDADLSIKIWEELHRLTARDVTVEVEHVTLRMPAFIA